MVSRVKDATDTLRRTVKLLEVFITCTLDKYCRFLGYLIMHSAAVTEQEMLAGALF